LTFFILDLMCWKGYLLYDCETDFRYYWMITKLQEVNVSDITPTNPFRFIPLQFHECDRESMSQSLSGQPPSSIDSFLFINKQTQYTMGETPLVFKAGVEKMKQIIQSFMVV